MILTLEEIMKNAFPEKNILSVKRHLQVLKKKGSIFFKEDLLLLESQRKFEMYYHVLPSHKTQIDAFPVSIVDFEFVIDTKEQLTFMKAFFEKYYCISKPKEYFHSYNYRDPFIGTHFLWFSKNKGCE